MALKRKDGRLNEPLTQASPSSAISRRRSLANVSRAEFPEGSTLLAIVVLTLYEMTLAIIFTVDFPPLHGD